MANVYLATDGNDSWDGSASTFTGGKTGPKATFQAAGGVIRAGKADTCLIVGGNYYLTKAVDLGPDDAGSSYLPHSDDSTVRIFGGPGVTGWRNVGAGVWTAKPPAGVFTDSCAEVDLFNDGNRMPHARWPERDGGPLGDGWNLAAPARSGQNTTISFQFDPGDIPADIEARGVYCVVYSQNGWQSLNRAVASIDYRTCTITLAEAVSLPIDYCSRYYIYAFPKGSLAPGEWYYDDEADLIHFRPEGAFASDTIVGLGTLGPIFNVYATHDVTIAGLTLSNTTPTGSCINVSGSHDVSVAGDRLLCCGQGVSFSSDSYTCIVEGNKMENVNQNGVSIPSGCSDITVAGNYIHAVGQLVTANAVWLSGSGKCKIRYNDIIGCSKHAVAHSSSAEGGSFNNDISYNRIAHVNLESSDGGAIYTNSGLYGTDGTKQGLTNLTICHNDISGVTAKGTHGWENQPSENYLDVDEMVSMAIYLDDWTAGVTVEGNILHDNAGGGIMNHGGWGNTFRDNLLVDNPGNAMQCANSAPGDGAHETANVLFEANLVYATDAMHSVNEGTPTNAQWRSNFYDMSRAKERPHAEDDAAYVAATFEDWQEAHGYDAGAGTGTDGERGFVDFARGDFRLAAGSAALAHGIKQPIAPDEIGIGAYKGISRYCQTWGQA